MIKNTLLILIAFIFSGVSAQNIPCFTNEVYELQMQNNPQLRALEDAANKQAREYLHSMAKAAGTRYIPVVFHVIHLYGNENISQDQINDQIRIINEDYRKKAGTNGGSSTDGLATDMEYEFRLAQFDPNGNPTDGVNRVFSSLTENASDATKSLSYWPSDRYLNVWVVKTIANSGSGTILGYAQFPWNRSSSPTTDGIIVRSDQVGTIGTGSSSQAGRTLTHEIGHWLGLYHTFQSGCGTGTSNCASQGDQVCDTPPANAANYGCFPSTNSCVIGTSDLPDQVRNYMDYSDGTCMNMFTPGQKSRTQLMTSSYRANAYSTTNLSSTGVDATGAYKPLTASAKKAPFSFSFAINNLSEAGYFSEAYNIHPDTAWKLNSSVGFSDNKCMYIRNNLTTRLNTRSSFSTASYDMTVMSTALLSFNIAYARRLAGANDKLLVYVSNNFGRTETLAKTYVPADMETMPVQTAEFTPANSSQWKNLMLDLSAYTSYSNLSIRFEFQNLRGNNIYLDDINISGPTGTAEELLQVSGFTFFPNPMTETATIRFSTDAVETISIQLYDLSGKMVKELHQGTMMTGSHELTLTKEGLGNGLYFLRYESPKGAFTTKVAIN